MAASPELFSNGSILRAHPFTQALKILCCQVFLEGRKTEMSRQLNAEKTVLCRQTALGRYALKNALTVKTYNIFLSYFQISTWQCHFKQRGNIIQPQST